VKVKTNKHGQWKLEEIEKASFEEDMGDIIAGKEKPMPKTNPPGVAKPHKPKSEIEPELATKVEKLETELKTLKKMSGDELKAKASGKDLIGVVGYGDSAKFGGGPAMTGKPRNVQLAQTKSGKPVMATHGPGGAENGYHKAFNAEDHRDAYFAHGKHARELQEGGVKVHPDLIQHHTDMSKFHWDQYQNMLTNRPAAVDQHGLKKAVKDHAKIAEEFARIHGVTSKAKSSAAIPQASNLPTSKEYEASRGMHLGPTGPKFDHLSDREVEQHHQYVSSLPREQQAVYTPSYRSALANEHAKRTAGSAIEGMLKE
jgi:hypothetical protein